MMGVRTLGGVTTIAVLYGFFSGVFIALPPVCFVRLTKDKSKIGTRIGMGFSLLGFGVLAGGPAGGAILDSDSRASHLEWDNLWIYGGCMSAGAGVSMCMLGQGMTSNR
jgi:hypothetical protein